jgi:hypothetical protein
VLSALCLHACARADGSSPGHDTGLGHLVVDPPFVSALQDALAAGPRSLGEVLGLFPIDLDEMVRRLSVLLHAGVIGVSFSAAPASGGTGSVIGAFNQRALAGITAGEEIGALLSPVLLHPVPLSLLEAFFLQTASAELPAEELVQLVLMGVAMAGGTMKDNQGQPIEDPQQALETLREAWETFSTDRLPVLQRLGIAPSLS